MPRPHFTIARSMAIVLCLGFGLAALRNADPFWAGATYTLAIVMLLAAPVGALARRGTARMAWAGFAAFGRAYLLIPQLPDWPIGGLGAGPKAKPVLLLEWGIVRLQPWTSPQSIRGGSWVHYEQVSLS